MTFEKDAVVLEKNQRLARLLPVFLPFALATGGCATEVDAPESSSRQLVEHWDADEFVACDDIAPTAVRGKLAIQSATRPCQ